MATNPQIRRRILRKGISEIRVRGYKSLLEESSIEIRPLTILAGANSSGKSSILQPILMLKQTLDATYDPGVLLLYGPNVKFTSIEQLFSKLIGKKTTGTFSTGVTIDQKISISHLFGKHPKKGPELQEFSYIEGDEKLTLKEGLDSEEIENLIPAHLKEIKTAMSEGSKYNFRWRVERNRCFLTVDLSSDRFPSDYVVSSYPPIQPFVDNIRKIIHVPGLRGNPERTYRTTAIGSEFPGTFENYVASVINHWQSNNSEQLQQLSLALEALGLTCKIEAKKIDDTQVELRVGRLPHGLRGRSRDTVNITDVGFGVSQTLPVIVALLLAESGQFVYIEQPEIHLHPRAQRAMAQLLADAAKRGVKVVVETHSSLLLRGIQTIVAKRGLPKEYVKLHWFTRRSEDGLTIINSINLDKNGAFGEWPSDFDEVELAAESDYLDSVERNFAQ